MTDNPGAPASGFDPSRVDWREVPHIRKVGRYALFGICAVSVNMVAYLLLRGGLGLNTGISGSTANIVSFVVFITLREMSKQWDAVLQQQARWFRDTDGSRNGGDACGSVRSTTAGAEGIAQDQGQ